LKAYENLKHASETLVKTPENTLKSIQKHKQHPDKILAIYL
jgi:hypothetical protein